MKKLATLTAIGLFGALMAQESEMKATVDAVASNDYATALQNAKAAESKLASSATVSPESLLDFYYNAGQAAEKSGNLSEAARYYAKVTQLESKPHYVAKNKDTKEKEYYFSKEVAEKAMAGGNYSKLKEATLSAKYGAEIAQNINQLYQKSVGDANNAFNGKDYATAAQKFTEAYYMTQALGAENKLLKYYAGLSYLQAKEYATSAKMFQELVDEGYTGVTTKYIATLKETGEDVVFGSQEEMNLQNKLGLYTNPRVEKTESLEEDLYNNLAFSYYQAEEWDKGLKVVEEGLAKFPNHSNLKELKPSFYFNSGKTAEFKSALQEKINDGSANAQDYFNLGKLLEDENAPIEEVNALYKKATEKDPTFRPAFINLGFNIIKQEKPLVDAMNANLGSSAKEKKIYNESKEQRKELYSQALPYLEKAYDLKSDYNILKVLTNTYEVVGMDEKYFEFKEKLKEARE